MKENKKIILENNSSNTKIFFRLYLLWIKSFIFSPLNVFLGVILIIFTQFIWLAFKGSDPFIFASAIGSLIVRNSCHTFYRTINMSRITGFTSRITYTKANNYLSPLSHLAASFTINFIVSLIMLGLTVIFFKEQRTLLSNVNWFMFVSGSILLWLLSILMCYTVYIYYKNYTLGNIVVIIIYMFCYNFLGLAFPYQSIAKLEWLNILLYLLPQRYMMNVMQAGWVNATSLVYSSPNFPSSSVDFKLTNYLWLPYLVTFLFIFLFFIINLTHLMNRNKQFKKDGYGSSVIAKLSNKYIRDIKRCSNIDELNELRINHLNETGHFDLIRNNVQKSKIRKQEKK
ncbi:hypothetical protein [Spiroplasma turonicum]|uniref:Uncharacterized protein n=1 Tax=Spiroplasma turonicum TaxID=216946 RepID=A0A0K1P6K8_9MOLU|nr:hypothetical protein [Spiroplasma turonicum]AKU79492.1 hypothetical protein STURON_00246 [Spiroplasma turonicum]ALX70513.1 ABC transporter permease protein [Spiroplasma turonicum]